MLFQWNGNLNRLNDMGRNLGYGGTNARMMRNQLRSLNDEGMRLLDLTRDDDKLPEWMVAKVITALDGITTARQYLQSKLKGMKRNSAHTSKEMESVTSQALRQAKAAAKGVAKYTRKAATTAKRGASLGAAKARIADLNRCGSILGLSQREIDETKAMKKAYDQLEKAEENWAKKIKNPSVGDERVKYEARRHDGGPKYRIVRIRQVCESRRCPSWSGKEFQTYQRWVWKGSEDMPFIEFHPKNVGVHPILTHGEVVVDYFFSKKDAKEMIQIIESDPSWSERTWDTTDGTQVQFDSEKLIREALDPGWDL